MFAVPQSRVSRFHHANRSSQRRPVARASVHDDANDDCVKADGRGEDDDDKHRDEGSTILRSNKSSAGAEYTNADAAESVRESNGDTDPESTEASVLSCLVSGLILVDEHSLVRVSGLLRL